MTPSEVLSPASAKTSREETANRDASLRSASVSAPDTSCRKAGGVADIIFLVDVTGSMQPCIDALKANIAEFLKTLSQSDDAAPVRDWRACVAGYRDYDFDDAPPFERFPFVRDAESLKEQLDALEAKGGGDEEESLLDALYAVATLGDAAPGAETPDCWRARGEAARIVVVFTDAPYKEVMRLPKARGGGFYDVANALMAERIILSLFAPDMPCYDRLAQIDKSEYRPIPYNPGDEYGPQKALAAFTSRQEAFRNTLMQLAKSVSKSAETPLL